MTSSRALAALTAGCLALGLLAGCAPTPEPKPTKTAAFASDEEAFAAAKKTYEEYNDASNARRAGNETPNPQDFLSGSALTDDNKAIKFFLENNVQPRGTVSVRSFTPDPKSLNSSRTVLSATVCLDISKNRLFDADGRDITPVDRANVISTDLEMRWVKSSFVISAEAEGDEGACES
ncbi:hypothetical protein [Microbacterium sp. NPDC057650]|uniref:hypothetical protein n=1 Tax=unclassified Microbacterium TaxID=2609290 RepID=UPI00366EE106